MSRKVLVVVHQEKSTPGRVGEFLTARGYELDRRCPMMGDPLPTDLSQYAASVVFGGPMSANDDHLPGIRAELDWLEKYGIPSGRPLLGICLGGQQIARVLGARVGRHCDGLVEIGYYEVAPTDSGGDFLDCPTVFYQWHTETFEIPDDTVLPVLPTYMCTTSSSRRPLTSSNRIAPRIRSPLKDGLVMILVRISCTRANISSSFVIDASGLNTFMSRQGIAGERAHEQEARGGPVAADPLARALGQGKNECAATVGNQAAHQQAEGVRDHS